MIVLILQLRELSIAASGVLSGGVTYTRWGHNACPSVPGTQMLYTGRMAKVLFDKMGGGANFLCLPNNSQYYTLNTYTSHVITQRFPAENTKFRLLVVITTMYRVVFVMLQQEQLK